MDAPHTLGCASTGVYVSPSSSTATASAAAAAASTRVSPCIPVLWGDRVAQCQAHKEVGCGVVMGVNSSSSSRCGSGSGGGGGSGCRGGGGATGHH